jgi:hypothetical protein
MEQAMARASATSSKNEGEGSRSAARAYNKGLRAHIAADKVGPAARKAKQAVDSKEGPSLRSAEAKGKARARH